MLYVDSSAVAKLVVEEDETPALRRFLLTSAAALATSVVSRVEVGRVAESRGGDVARRADAVLAGFVIIGLSDGIVRESVTLEPRALRSLDAIHVASALALGPECEGLVTYDGRMQAASRLVGIPVVAPA